MKFYIGQTGLEQSWQTPFEKTTVCCKCGKEADIMFVGFEDYPQDEDNFICQLHETSGKEGSLWLHDACAVAVYLCPNCFKATALVNQA